MGKEIVRAKEFITEVNMSPGHLSRFIAQYGSNAIAGFEAELVFPGDYDEERSNGDRNYDRDERILDSTDLDEVQEFYHGEDLFVLHKDYNKYVDDSFEQHVNSNHRHLYNDLESEDPDFAELSFYEQEQIIINAAKETFDQPDLGQYLRDEHQCKMMSDLADEYNLEYPHLIEKETFEESCDSLSYYLQMGLDATVEISNSYHGGTRDNETWVLEPDSSINHNEYEKGVEIISPPMQIPMMLTKMKRCFEIAERQGGVANNSCGLHVSVSLEGMDRTQTDYMKLVLFLGDRYVLEKFGRAANTFTESALTGVENYFISTRDNFPQDLTNHVKLLRAGLLDEAAKTMINTNVNRNTSVSVRSNYIEFRSMGNTDYLLRFDEVKETVLRYVTAYIIASNPQLYREEYLKKLAKVINPNGYQRLDPFVNYAAGQITKEEMVEQLKNLQKLRKHKKDLDQWNIDKYKPNKYAANPDPLDQNLPAPTGPTFQQPNADRWPDGITVQQDNDPRRLPN